MRCVERLTGTTFAVKLAGTTPLLMNRRVFRPDERPTASPQEIASLKIHRAANGAVCVPRDHLRWTVAAAGRTIAPKLHYWPRDALSMHGWASVACTDGILDARLWTTHAGIDGYWSYPRFDAWSVRFGLWIDAAQYDPGVIRQALETAGKTTGLPHYAAFAGPGDWCRFTVESWEEAADSTKSTDSGATLLTR